MDRLSRSTHSSGSATCPTCSSPMLLSCSSPEGRRELFVCPLCGRVKTRIYDWAELGVNLRVA